MERSLDDFPEYCHRCLQCKHEGLCERWWSEIEERWIYDGEDTDLINLQRSSP